MKNKLKLIKTKSEVLGNCQSLLNVNQLDMRSVTFGIYPRLSGRTAGDEFVVVSDLYFLFAIYIYFEMKKIKINILR